MSFFDRFRAPDVRERHERERAERAAAAEHEAEAERLRQAAAQEAEWQRFWFDAIGPELAAAPVDTPANAKLAIKLARIRKRELQAEKRELGVGLADERERWRERQAGRYYTGGLGRRSFVRQMVQSNRRQERLGHAAVVNQYGDAKQEIDRKIDIVEKLMIDLERTAVGGTPAK